MKIYVNGYDYSQMNVMYEHTFKNVFIYTNECIYSNYKKELHKIEYNENKIEEYNYNNYHFFLDNTKLTYTETIQHIPYYHLWCEEIMHKLNIGEGIHFIKNNYFDQDSYFFETDNINENTFNKIISFLSSN